MKAKQLYEKKYTKMWIFEKLSQILILELITFYQFEQEIQDVLQILIESYDFPGFVANFERL